MFENKHLLLNAAKMPDPGQITWRSPSNIAIIKYWGKHGVQLPKNPSLSLTLAASCTDTMLEYAPVETPSDRVCLDFFFHQEEQPAFKAKIEQYLNSLLPLLPFLTQLKLTIRSGNSFPHSAGIASSASAMSALALCLCSLEDLLFGTLSNPQEFDQKASYLARLGSGSACRSIFPYAAIWGTTDLVKESTDLYAVPAENLIHEVFKDFQDDILIVSSDEKSVSSSAGHALMDGNPFAESRYQQANSRLATLLNAMRAGDLDTFGKITEAESLTLHALMMCSDPSYLLLKPETLAIMEKVRAYRAETGNPVYFSIDAGPNIHLLYPGEIVHEVRGFIDEQLLQHCENQTVQHDWVGEGPEEV
jgi:diphosphomevalonate decarboxylase